MNYQNSAYLQQSNQDYQQQQRIATKQPAVQTTQQRNMDNGQMNRQISSELNQMDNHSNIYTIQSQQKNQSSSMSNPYKINHYSINQYNDQQQYDRNLYSNDINNENMNYENLTNKGNMQFQQDFQRSFQKINENIQNKISQNRPLQLSVNSNNSSQTNQMLNSQIQQMQNLNQTNNSSILQLQKSNMSINNNEQNPEQNKNQMLKINVSLQDEKQSRSNPSYLSKYMQQNQGQSEQIIHFNQKKEQDQQLSNFGYGVGQQKESSNQIQNSYLNHQNTASTNNSYGQHVSSQNTMGQITQNQNVISKDLQNLNKNNGNKETKQQQKNLDESMIVLNQLQDMSRQKNDSNIKQMQTQNVNSMSQGPTTIGGLHSSGGSLGSQSYNSISIQNMARSKTHGKIGYGQKKTNILQMIKCPCQPEQNLPHLNLIVSNRGKKQPILHSSDNTANCGHCGQFYAVKDQQITHFSASGKKQISTQSQIIKTIRERTAIFKLDEPISEIFRRMREVSKKVLDKFDPNTFYLTKRIKRIDNLSYIADTLQSENQTIHHAVHLMDIYSSKVPKNEEYDTVLISLVCLLISTKYLQIKYPGADALNYQVNNRYNSDLIIATEGKVLEIIDWQLMVFPLFDYVKLFISQGCLFENEKILPNMNLQPQDRIDKPTVQLAEHFRKYAEFFADFCLYQQCFMTVDPYLLSCAIVAYTRKYMGVAIIWRNELELLTKCTFHHFRELYLIIESKYKENFPEHANSQNHKDQLLTEPIPQHVINPQSNMRKNLINQLQLSSGGKTKQSQNSSNKHATSANNTNITNNIFGELKTPDKYVFDFNSVVSENKNTTQNKGGFSHDKFQISSNSVEKYKGQKKIVNTYQHQKVADISANQNTKTQGMVFSDNKRQSVNAHSFKKLILKNQTNNTLSDEKKISNPHSQNQLVQQDNYVQYQKRNSQVAKNNTQQKMVIQDMSQMNQQNQTQISINQGASVTSPSANIGEAENEEEVPPFKPMIIKSNSQAISGGYECKTTTKKSPKVEDLDKINNLKESMKSVNITAKLPSSTTNQSASNSNMNSFQKPNNFNQKDNKFSNRKSTGGFGSLGFGVGHGPIKISQKITIVNSSNKKGQVNGMSNGAQQNCHSTAEKNKCINNDGATTSSQKLKISKSYISQIQCNQTLRQNLSKSYQQKLAEQRARNQSSEALTKSCIQQSQQVIDLSLSQIAATQIQAAQRNSSCSSTNNVQTNPNFRQQSYISGKPKDNMDSYEHNNKNEILEQLKENQNYGGILNKGQFGAFDNKSIGDRSILSVKNAAEVIKRKGSNYQNNQTIDLRVNINKPQPQLNDGIENSVFMTGDIQQQIKGKNVPNGLLRRATGGAQGRQKSIGHLSNYMPNGNNVSNINNKRFSQNKFYPDVDSQGSIEGKSAAEFEQYLPRNISIEDLSNQEDINSKYLHNNINSFMKNQKSVLKKTVDPPAIILNGVNSQNQKSTGKNCFTNDKINEQLFENNETTLSQTKAALMKIQNNFLMDQPNNIISSRTVPQFQTLNNTRMHSNERPSNLSVRDNFQTNFQQDNVFSKNMANNMEQNVMMHNMNENNIQMIQDIMNTSKDENYIQLDAAKKPIQKMIKSGSQVLGKQRSRLNLSRREMLKQLNDKKEKMSHMVEAAHATRPTSNERNSQQKPQGNEKSINSNDLSINKDYENNIQQQQLFTSKNSQNGLNNGNRINLAVQFDIQKFEEALNSHSQERPQINSIKNSKNLNMHSIISQQSTQSQKPQYKNNEKYLNEKSQINQQKSNLQQNQFCQQPQIQQNYQIMQNNDQSMNMMQSSKIEKGNQKQMNDNQYQNSLIQKAAAKSMMQMQQSNSSGRLAAHTELQMQQQLFNSQNIQQQHEQELRKIQQQMQIQLQAHHQHQQLQMQKQKQQMQIQQMRNSKLE